MAWEGREPLRDWIRFSVSLCFCAPPAALSPFRLYMEIRNSDCTETFAVIFLPKISFLALSSTRLMGGPRGSGARPVPRGHLRHRLAWIFLPEFSKYSKNILCPFLSSLIPFYMDIL